MPCVVDVATAEGVDGPVLIGMGKGHLEKLVLWLVQVLLLLDKAFELDLVRLIYARLVRLT